jgi:hypothetical protein
VFIEAAYSKEEGLMTLEGGEGEKAILKSNLSIQGIEPQRHVQKTRVLTTTLQYNKV